MWPDVRRDEMIVAWLGQQVERDPDEWGQWDWEAGAPPMVRTADQLLFHKMTDWQSEAEYRYVVVDETKDHIDVKYGNALKTVVLGPKFPDWGRDGAVALCKPKGIDVCQGEWDGFGLQPRALGPQPT
jgi:hypothetical protein